MENLKFKARQPAIAGRGGESGQALIELAVSLPLFLVLLLGAAEMARLAYMAIEVTEAAKAAAQYGAQNATSSVDTAGITLTAQKNAPYVNANCTSFSATPTYHLDNNSNVQLPCTCVTNGTPSPATPTYTACSAACTSPSYLVSVLQITTTASCDPLIHGWGMPTGSITLNGGAIQEVLN